LLSGDGTVIAAVQFVNSRIQEGSIWISRDGGETWCEDESAGTGFWGRVMLSYDGSTLAAIRGADTSSPASIYTSRGVRDGICIALPSIRKDLVGSNSRYELASTAITGQWSDIAATTHLTYMVAVQREDSSGAPGFIYRSIDQGRTWTRRDPPGRRYWKHVIASTYGKYFAALADNPFSVWASGDGGITWTEFVNLLVPPGDEAVWAGLAGSSELSVVVAVQSRYFDGGPGEIFLVLNQIDFNPVGTVPRAYWSGVTASGKNRWSLHAYWISHNCYWT